MAARGRAAAANGRGRTEGGGPGAAARGSRGGAGAAAAAGGGCGRAAGRPRGRWRWRWSAAASCSSLWGCARPAHRTVSADCGAPTAGHPTPARGAPLPPAPLEIPLRSPGWERTWCGMGTGKRDGRGRALRCVRTGIDPGWAPGNGFPLCPDRTRPGQGRRGAPAPVPFRSGISAIPLSRYRNGRGSRRPPVLVLVRDGVPNVPLFWYRTGRALSLLPPPSHHAGPAPTHFPRSPPAPALSIAASGGDCPGCSESPASGSIPPAGLSREPPIHGLRGSLEFTCRAGRAGQWAPSQECRGTRQRPGGFVAAGSRTTPRECSPKRDPSVRVSRCHSAPTHPRERKQRRVIQGIILFEGKLRHRDRLGSLEAESRYVPRV